MEETNTIYVKFWHSGVGSFSVLECINNRRIGTQAFNAATMFPFPTHCSLAVAADFRQGDGSWCSGKKLSLRTSDLLGCMFFQRQILETQISSVYLLGNWIERFRRSSNSGRRVVSRRLC